MLSVRYREGHTSWQAVSGSTRALWQLAIRDGSGVAEVVFSFLDVSEVGRELLGTPEI